MRQEFEEIYVVGVNNLESALAASVLKRFGPKSDTTGQTVHYFPVSEIDQEFSAAGAAQVFKAIEFSSTDPARLTFFNVNQDSVEGIVQANKVEYETPLRFLACASGSPETPIHPLTLSMSLLEKVLAENSLWPRSLQFARTQIEADLKRVSVFLSGSPALATAYYEQIGQKKSAAVFTKHVALLDMAIRSKSAHHLNDDNHETFCNAVPLESLITLDNKRYCILSAANNKIEELVEYADSRTRSVEERLLPRNATSDQLQQGNLHRWVFLHTGRDNTLPGDVRLAETLIVEAPIEDRIFATHAALKRVRNQYNREATDPVNTLLLCYDNSIFGSATSYPRQLVAIDFLSHDCHRSIATITDNISAPLKPLHFQRDVSRLTVLDHRRATPESMSTIADDLLNETLLNQRPVVAWRSCFFRAFRLPARYETNHQGSTEHDRAGRWLKLLFNRLQHRSSLPDSGIKRLKTDASDRAYWLRHIPPLWDREVDCSVTLEGLSTLVSYEWQPTQALQIRFWHGDDQKVPRTSWHNSEAFLTIGKVRLHFFYLDTVIIEWQVEETFDRPSLQQQDAQPNDYTVNDYKTLAEKYEYLPAITFTPPTDSDKTQKWWQLPLWYQLINTPDTDNHSTAYCLDRLHMLRHVYSGFEADDSFEAHALWEMQLCRNNNNNGQTPGPDETGETLFRGRNSSKNVEQVSGFIADLLTEMASQVFENAPQQNITKIASMLQSIGDDRAAHLTSLVVAGSLPQLYEGRKHTRNLCTRLRMADYAGATAHYDADWEDTETDTHLYTRWWNSGSLFSAADQGFAFLGAGRFAYTQIHHKHMHRHYHKMFLLVQFYADIVQGFQARVASATRGMQTQPVKLDENYLALLPLFHKFRNQLWFQRLSSQVQANELFDIMTRTSRGTQEYDELENQIAQTQQYWSDYKDREAESRARSLTAIGLPLGIVLGLKTILSIDIWKMLKETGCAESFAVGSVEWWWVVVSVVVIGACRLCGIPAEIGSHLEKTWQRFLLYAMYLLPTMACIFFMFWPVLNHPWCGLQAIFNIN